MRRVLKSTSKFYNKMRFQIFKDNNKYILHLMNSSQEKAKKKRIDKFADVLVKTLKEIETMTDEELEKNFNLNYVEQDETIYKTYEKDITDCKENIKILNELKQNLKNYNLYKVIENASINAMKCNFSELYKKEENYKEVYGIYVNEFKADLNEIILNITFSNKNEETEETQEDFNIDVVNGNYVKVDLKEEFNIKSIWYTINENTDYTAKSFAVDFETDLQTIQEIDENGLIENANDGNLVEYQAVSFSLCDIERQFAMTSTNVFVSNDELVEYLFYTIEQHLPAKTKKVRLYFHNLNFDGTYIVSYLLRNGYKNVQDNTLTETNTFSVIENSGLISIKINSNNLQYDIRDTARLLNSSLANISKEFAKDNDLIIKKEDTTYRYNIHREKGYNYNKAEIVYCINDVIATSLIPEFLDKVLFGDVKLTIAGTAYNEFKLSFQFGILDTKSLLYVIYYLVNTGIINQMSEDASFIMPITSQNWETFFIDTTKGYLLKDWYGENIDLNISDFYSFCEYFKNNIKNDYNIEELKEHFENRIEKYPYTKFLSETLNYTTAKIINRISYINKNKEDFENAFNCYFPKLSKDEDAHLRRAYRGGLTIANLDYIGVDTQTITEKVNGASADIKSSYPNVMSNFKTPYGNMFCIYDIDKIQNLMYNFENNKALYTTDYFVLLRVSGTVKIKKGFLPNLFKNSVFSSENHVYNAEINDYFLSLQEYFISRDIYDLDVDVNEIIMFNTVENMFTSYYDRYFNLKEKFKNTGLYGCVKIMCNSLYGKFGENTYSMAFSKTSVELDKQGLVTYKSIEEIDEIKREEIEDKMNYKYLPCAVFATCLARVNLMKGVKSIVEAGGVVLYTDTDSCYFIADNIEYNYKGKRLKNSKETELELLKDDYLYINSCKTEIKVGKNLGNWEIEHYFDRFLTLCPKKYILHDYKENQLITRCAGISSKYVKEFTFDDYAFNLPHKTNKSRNTTYGKEIYTDLVVAGYKQNVYITDDGLSYQSEKLYNINDTITTEYHETKTIKEILYIK